MFIEAFLTHHEEEEDACDDLLFLPLLLSTIRLLEGKKDDYDMSQFMIQMKKLFSDHLSAFLLLPFLLLLESSSVNSVIVKKYVRCHSAEYHYVHDKDYYLDTNDSNVCIVAQFSARFFIDYETPSGELKTSTLEIPADADVLNGTAEYESTPNDDEVSLTSIKSQVMALEFSKQKHVFSMKFQKNQSEVCVSHMSISYYVSENDFPDHKEVGHRITNNYSKPIFCVSENYGYSCQDVFGLRFDDCNTLIRMGFVRLESFRHSDQKDFIWTSTLCPKDIIYYKPTPFEIAAIIVTGVVCFFLLTYICRQWTSDYP